MCRSQCCELFTFIACLGLLIGGLVLGVYVPELWFLGPLLVFLVSGVCLFSMECCGPKEDKNDIIQALANSEATSATTSSKTGSKNAHLTAPSAPAASLAFQDDAPASNTPKKISHPGSTAVPSRAAASRIQSQGARAGSISITAAKSPRAASNFGYCNDCTICFERARNVALIPCGHVTCKECARKVLLSNTECPYCRTALISYMDVVL